MSKADGETHELFVKALEKEEEGKKSRVVWINDHDGDGTLEER